MVQQVKESVTKLGNLSSIFGTPHDGRKELTPASCPSMTFIHAIAHKCVHTHIHTKII